MFDISKYADRTHLKRRNTIRHKGWQFATKKRGFEETKSFADSTYGGPDESYAAAIAYRDKFLEAARELGIANEDGIIDDRRPIYTKISARNTSGISGVNRYARPKSKGLNIREASWVANYKNADGKNEQQMFPIFSLGEKEALLRAVRFRRDFVDRTCSTLEPSEYKTSVENHVLMLDELVGVIEELVDDDQVFAFLSTLNSSELSSTEKQSLIDTRIGQRRFRKQVLGYWDNRCALTGAGSLLTASHIKPWCVSTDAERLSVFNGLCLSPLYDACFDRGLISFTVDGLIAIHSGFENDAKKLGLTGRERLSKIHENHVPYLLWHRTNVFKIGEHQEIRRSH